MGQQYRNWFTDLGYSVDTLDVDPSKNATFNSVEQALETQYEFIYIGTPNWTHETIARQVANNTKILLIEKPGFKNSSAWESFSKEFPNTRITMVKNNQYRFELSGYQDLAIISKSVTIKWSRCDGVPGAPWFTQKDKAFGGVSRDLMTHLLSYYTALTDYSKGRILEKKALDIHNTGVDDYCEISLKNKGVEWKLIADWKNESADEHYIEFDLNVRTVRFELGDYMTAFGGCPAGPYLSMITACKDNIDNKDFWQKQLTQDLWIHTQVEPL